jgi:hypothetical protein
VVHGQEKFRFWGIPGIFVMNHKNSGEYGGDSACPPFCPYAERDEDVNPFPGLRFFYPGMKTMPSLSICEQNAKKGVVIEPLKLSKLNYGCTDKGYSGY